MASSIGFQILAGYTFGIPVQTFTSNYKLTGNMNISLTNVILKMPDGNLTPLTAANAAAVGFGNINTNPSNLNIDYDFVPGALLWQSALTGAVANSQPLSAVCRVLVY